MSDTLDLFAPDEDGDELPEEFLPQLERLEAMAVLCGGVVHDVASLMGAIRVNAQSVLRRKVDRATRLDLDTIVRCTEHAEQLIGNLLKHARPPEEDMQAVDVSAVIQENERTLRVLAGRHVRFELALERVPPVLATQIEILQVVANLVANASEAMNGGGHVRLATSYDGEAVTLSVADDGPGFEPEDAARAFRPFYTTKPRGFGLGLSLVDRTARRHGARVRIVSRKGRGARVDVVFPVSRSL